jgi:aminoglycoside 6'-N-acetyltransferase
MGGGGGAIEFRPLERSDFALLARWLSEPQVAWWWNHETTDAAIERDFGPAVDGREPTDVCVASVGHRPCGLIQRYAIDAYPEYVEQLAPVIAIPPGALSIDYLVGEPDLRGRGLATRMIATWVERSWGAYPGAGAVIVPVAAGNVGSWRALERAGFARVARAELEPDNPRESRDHYLYRLERPAAAGRGEPPHRMTGDNTRDSATGGT